VFVHTCGATIPPTRANTFISPIALHRQEGWREIQEGWGEGGEPISTWEGGVVVVVVVVVVTAAVVVAVALLVAVVVAVVVIVVAAVVTVAAASTASELTLRAHVRRKQ
jgi:hypothetical protein